MSVLDSGLWNSLCLILPLIADDDPALVKLLLDPQTWKTLVTTNSSLTANKREEIIHKIAEGYFPHVLNNALLHVFAALANNHFLKIRDYLGHSSLHGSYTGLMPHYLFAILFQKVVQLHDLAAESRQVTMNNDIPEGESFPDSKEAAK